MASAWFFVSVRVRSANCIRLNKEKQVNFKLFAVFVAGTLLRDSPTEATAQLGNCMIAGSLVAMATSE